MELDEHITALFASTANTLTLAQLPASQSLRPRQLCALAQTFLNKDEHLTETLFWYLTILILVCICKFMFCSNQQITI